MADRVSVLGSFVVVVVIVVSFALVVITITLPLLLLLPRFLLLLILVVEVLTSCARSPGVHALFVVRSVLFVLPRPVVEPTEALSSVIVRVSPGSFPAVPGPATASHATRA